jgi:DNA-binding MarR family transcriptional regulator/GNAT superfamily N-acetyltransferase
MDPAMIEQVRSFNRAVTQRAGALDDRFLARGRPLGQSRLLWEIGAGGSDLRTLRSRLDLDSGYLSRLLGALQEQGLVTVEPSPRDGRVRTARLTNRGLAEWAELDRRSGDLAASILAPLSTPQRGRLLAAMTEVQRLLAASAVQIVTTDARHPDARACLQAYFQELSERFEEGFDPAQSSAGEAALVPPAGLVLLASLHGEPVGCGGLTFHYGPVPAIKRMWVSRSVRGLGLGRRLLAALEERAAAHGASLIRLETNRALTEAVPLYRSSGYREIAPFNDEKYAHHWFEKALTPPTAPPG